MSKHRRIITCICCGQDGPSRARRLIQPCYDRHKKRGTLTQYPRVTNPDTWHPTGSHGQRMLARYQQLTSLRPPLSIARIAFELGVSERQVQRYASATRATGAISEVAA
ncbi:hypothetical protein [Nonomuraea sp. SYSU D8015]|uniref:hypothetical protein n=1 Tax=Nonomuraea sp. SYSU D8015 TaxID=2593644 RepID=UPI0016600826|nr:hypothetical protein [Nonomuraea sp. SYSU D8015]